MAVDAVKRGWRRLAGDPLTAATTFLFLALTAWLGPHLVQWLFVSAIWEATGHDACAAPGAGACWAFLREKWALILFGAFPHEMMWRPALGTALVILAATGERVRHLRRFHRARRPPRRAAAGA